MNTLLDDLVAPAAEEENLAVDDPGERLQSSTAAIRLSFMWFGARKALSSEQKARAAESFGAEGDLLSAGKKLLNVRHPKFKAVTQIRGRAAQFWRAKSLPFPEPGLRLVRQDDIAEVNVQMGALKEELHEAVAELNQHYDELKTAARQRLGDLYNESDYPATLVGLFDMTWDFPSIEPPSYLRRLSPELYRRECERMRARFDEAVQAAEQMFLEELSKLVEHLTERLSGDSDGKPKVFRDTAVTNLTEFFERFRHLNIRTNEQLDALVENAQQVVRGVEPQQLRDSQQLRQEVATQMSAVQANLDQLLVDRPRRNILRRPR